MTGARVQWKLLHLAPFTLAPTSVTQIALTIPGVSHSKWGLIDSSCCSGCQAKGSESALIKGNSVNTRKDNLGGSVRCRWKQLHLLITILIRWESPGQSVCSYHTLDWSGSVLNGDSGQATSVLWIERVTQLDNGQPVRPGQFHFVISSNSWVGEEWGVFSKRWWCFLKEYMFSLYTGDG